MPSRSVQRDIMKATTFSTTTVFLIVAFGMTTFMLFGFSTFASITHSADVISKNIEHLNAIDAAHLIKQCMEGDDGKVTDDDIMGFSKSSCESIFPGLKALDYECMIESMEDPSITSRSPGYDSAMSGGFTEYQTTHSMFITISVRDSDVHIGRIHVQRK